MQRIKLSKWWEGSVYRNAAGNDLSRKNLVFCLRSQDGGSHVDADHKNEEYFRFLKYGDHVSSSADGSISVYTSGNTSVLALQTVRQIAWELSQAIAENDDASRLLTG